MTRIFISALVLFFWTGMAQADPPQGKGKGGKHWKQKQKHKIKHKIKHEKRHPHAQRYPHWARGCGLPPGLAKQGKIPPGWEVKCRSGKKYYQHEAEFKREVYGDYHEVDHEHPYSKTVYEMDAADCKVKALNSAGGVAEGVAKGAVFGGLIGAAGGAIIEAVRKDGDVADGAIIGGAGGAAGGAVLGGILASNEYKDDYRRCMKRRGH